MRSVHRLALVVALATAAVSVGSAGATSISENALLPVDQQPQGIASTSGALWFGEGSAGDLGTLNISSLSGSQIGLSAPATAVATTSSGMIWAAEPSAHAVSEVTNGVATAYQVSATAQPQGIAIGPSGTIWVTAISPAEVVELNGSTGAVMNTYTLATSAQPGAITEGADGNMWFTDSAANAIDRITTAGVVTPFTQGLTVGDPTSIAAGSGNTLWFTAASGSGAIGEITTSGTITEFTKGLTQSDPTSIALGPSGDMWFTAAGAIGRITPAGVITEFTQGLSETPTSITEGSDANMWFTETANPGRIGTVALTPDISSPTVTQVSPTSVMVSGTVNPNGKATFYLVDWGTSTSYGSWQPLLSQGIGSGTADVPVSQTISGLTPGTTYHFRFSAVNLSGTTLSTDASFTPTAATSTTTGTTTTTTPTTTTTSTTTTSPTTTNGGGAGSPTTPPTLDKTAVVGAVSGTVIVTVKGDSTPVPIGEAKLIPLGSLIDATHGKVRITDAIAAGGRTQSATVWGGAFTLSEARSGMTTMYPANAPACLTGQLADNADNPHTAGSAPVHLWAHDHDGRYSTHGQNSVATVRGTIWETIESCAGTRTVVRRGVVSVRNLYTHVAVLVRAGHSYLARS